VDSSAQPVETKQHYKYVFSTELMQGILLFAASKAVKEVWYPFPQESVNNNNQDHIYGAVIMAHHSESSYGSFDGWLVGWGLTSLFSTNMAISEMKGQGWRVILTQWRKASDILTSTLATFLFCSHPKRERDREAHLNYYASGYNRGRQLLHRKLN